MRVRSRKAPAEEPRTYVGQMLCAALVGDNAMYRERGAKVNGGKDGWNDDEPAVMEAACELAVHGYFPADVDVRLIAAFVSEMREKIKQRKAVMGQLELEAVIRMALGEDGVSIRGIQLAILFEMRMAVVVQISYKLELDKVAVGQLTAEAERLTFQRGWNPPLADD